MKMLLAIASLVLATSAFAHPDGTYVINGDRNVTVTFKKLKTCPAVAGAMRGSLRALQFSKVASQHPYNFKTGYFVEIHTATGEAYVNTNVNCVPTNTVAYPASHNSFDVYSLQKLQ